MNPDPKHWRKVGKEEFRKVMMQERRYTGKDVCRTGGMQDRSDAGKGGMQLYG